MGCCKRRVNLYKSLPSAKRATNYPVWQPGIAQRPCNLDKKVPLTAAVSDGPKHARTLAPVSTTKGLPLARQTLKQALFSFAAWPTLLI